ncbi:MAG: primosomal protein [Dehalococcoidia bacterium]|nr:primosomal protein [Dehalococcoidia bacterium]
MMRYAEVAVDAPTGYDRTFTYSVPLAMALSPGHLVQVPFGPRVLPGVVFQLTHEPQVAETRDIIGITHPQPILSTHQLALARWVSRYYMAPLFDCSALMTPPGLPSRALCYLSLTHSPSELKLTPAQGRALGYIASRGRVERGALLKALGPRIDVAISSLVRRGVIEASWQWQKPRVGPKYATYLELTLSPSEAEERAARLLVPTAPRWATLLRYMAQRGTPAPLAAAQKEFGPSAIKSLEAKNLIRRTLLRLERDPLRGKTFPPDSPPILTRDQRHCVERIEEAIDSPSSQVFLLQGITGSGKTEVYLHALAHALRRGKRGIVMVPELSLTPQTIERFSRRFPGQVAVLHSGLSPGEHFDQWWRIREGEYGVVIGSRSSVFAPQPDLGLIVLDEEHEGAYKQQDTAPRYHARDVALKLAELTGAVVILGSATPDLVSYSQALHGRFQLLELPQRIVSTPGGEPSLSTALPSVQVVDLRAELKEGNRSIFSRDLRRAMEQTLQAGEQVMLYLNRRGSSSLVQCRDCGHTLRCRRCDLPLTYHAQEERLLCHRCNYRLIPPRLCPQCQGPRIRYLGLGTQRAMEDVQRAFPGVKALRWDRDAASARGAHERTMELFLQGEAQVLVGTQMIARGLHFPNVTLVGVLCADIGLFLPDFRAGERVFQLLCQVAGRTGRGPLGGRVIVQTYTPDHYAVAAAAAQDYKSFYKSEMAYRREQELPPFGRLIHLVYLHTNQALCQREAVRLGGELKRQRDAWGLTNVDILGPAPAYPPRLRGHHRWHVILRGQDPRSLLDKVPMPRGWTVDVDPTSLT